MLGSLPGHGKVHGLNAGCSPGQTSTYCWRIDILQDHGKGKEPTLSFQSFHCRANGLLLMIRNDDLPERPVPPFTFHKKTCH